MLAALHAILDAVLAVQVTSGASLSNRRSDIVTCSWLPSPAIVAYAGAEYTASLLTFKNVEASPHRDWRRWRLALPRLLPHPMAESGWPGDTPSSSISSTKQMVSHWWLRISIEPAVFSETCQQTAAGDGSISIRLSPSWVQYHPGCA